MLLRTTLLLFLCIAGAAAGSEEPPDYIHEDGIAGMSKAHIDNTYQDAIRKHNPVTGDLKQGEQVYRSNRRGKPYPEKITNPALRSHAGINQSKKAFLHPLSDKDREVFKSVPYPQSAYQSF